MLLLLLAATCRAGLTRVERVLIVVIRRFVVLFVVLVVLEVIGSAACLPISKSNKTFIIIIISLNSNY